MTMHRNKHSLPRRESPVNASWPDVNAKARLDPSQQEEEAVKLLQRTSSGLSLSSSSSSLQRGRRRRRIHGNTWQQRSLEVKERLLARVHMTELLKSLRTDQFVGKVNHVSHAIYMKSPGKGIPDPTYVNDATDTSIVSSISSSQSETSLSTLLPSYVCVENERIYS